MNSPKFGDPDRKRVIEAVEDYYGIKLKQVGRRPKWCQDELDRSWWIMGGLKNWHAIPQEMMEAEERNPTEGVLVVAKVERRGDKDAYDIFACSLEKIIKKKNELSQANDERGDYQFTYHTIGSNIQIADVILKKITSFSYERPCRETEAMERPPGQSKLFKARKAVNALTAEEKSALMKELLEPKKPKELKMLILASLSEEKCKKLLRKLLDEFL